MGRKRRVPSPPPPPPPPQEESSSEEDSSAEEEEDVEATPATQKSSKPPSTTATVDDADSSDGSDEESSDSGKIDAEAFELRQIAASSGKRAAAAASEVKSEDQEPIPPGKAKKGKAGEKAAPEPSPLGKAKKAMSRAAEKPPSEVSPSSEGKKKHKAQPEKTTPSGKPENPGQLRRWTTEDEIKVLEALVRHVKANGTQPGAGELIAAVGGSLQRKNCRNTEMYEKVRNFRARYEKAVSTGHLPVKGDDLLKFELSEQVWGENAKQVAAASMALNDAGSPKSKKKGRTSKEKTDGYSNGGAAKEAENVGTATERNKGQVTEEKVDEDTKGRSSKNANIVDTPAKNKKRGNHKELEGDAKAGTTNTKKTVHTASANGGTSVRSKSGKSDRERKDEDADSPRPKEATTATQNDRSLTLLKEGEIHEEKMDTDANVKGMRKGFDELQNLYPNLTSCAESIQAQHPCGETLKRAFEFIEDEKAHALESKLKKQRVAELRMETCLADITKLVTNTFIGLLD